MGIKAKPPYERFWDKVAKAGPDECWDWKGARHTNGYGFLRWDPTHIGKYWIKAHRLSWEIDNGQEVPEGLCVLHHCDRPSCVNPRHLYIGTRAQNAKDRAVRRRGKEHHQNGAANDNAKLTEAKVKAIAAMLDAGITQDAAAAVFGVSQTQVWRIANRVTWRHLWDE